MLASCRTPSSPLSHAEVVRRSQPLLGTFVVVTAYGTNAAQLDAATSAAFAEVRRVDALLSIHREDSELAKLNATAAKQPVHISDELFSVLKLGQEIAVQTGGAFDLTIRPITELWGFIWKEYRLPTSNELAAVLPRVGHQFLELDHVNKAAHFSKPGVSVDSGGIGKGYAVDCAVATLRKHGVTNALVRAGGDLRVIGTPPDESAWEVQIEDPQKTGRRTTLRMRDAAISTSGNYENFFAVDGKRYSHVINPRTGLPVENVAACSVIAPTCIESDAWATALMVLGVERSEKMFGGRIPMRFVVSDSTGKLQVRANAFPPTTAAR